VQGIFGCGAHSDYGVMTLLAVADGVPGLQIKCGTPLCVDCEQRLHTWVAHAIIPLAYGHCAICNPTAGIPILSQWRFPSSSAGHPDTVVVACSEHIPSLRPLHQTQLSGQCCRDGRRGESWVNVPAVPNTILVNLGDMLERWTNGLYKSTMHRVWPVPTLAPRT